MLHPIHHLALLLLLVVPLAGCSSNQPQDISTQNHTLIGPTWTLVSLGEADNPQPVLDQTEITALFAEEAGRLAGSAGCNRYTASYEHSGGDLTISQPASTRKACPKPIMAQEQAYLEALASAEGWTREGNTLEIVYGAGEQRLRFRAQADQTNLPDFGGMPPQETGRTFVYECDGFEITMKTGPGQVALWLPERFDQHYVVLPQVRAASGAKYQDGDLTFWSKGEEALFEIDGTTYQGCRQTPR